METKLLQALETNFNSDGFTEPLKGTLGRYIVALTDNVNPGYTLLLTQANAFSQLDNINVGGWVDNSNLQDWNDVWIKYIDISTSFNDLDEAIIFWKAFNQKAIFDIETFEEIRIF